MKINKIAAIVSIAVAIPTIGAAAFYTTQWVTMTVAGDRFKSIEENVSKNSENIEVVGRNLNWVRLENLERKLKRRGLTRKECSVYRKLAKFLDVTPLLC